MKWERWVCECGQATRLKLCLSCGREAPWSGEILRQVMQHKDVAGRDAARCGGCSQILTDPVSVQRGYGPGCWQKRLDHELFREGKERREQGFRLVVERPGCCD